MSAWLRDGDGRSAEGNGLGVTAITERYVVVGQVDPAALAADPTAYIGGMAGELAPLPDYGTPHPNFPGIRLRTWSVSNGNGNTFATASYSLGSAVFEPEFFSRSGGYQTENWTFPYARRVRYTVPSQSGASVGFEQVNQDLWKLETVSVRQTVRRNEIVVNIGGLIGDAVKAMDNQNNRIHIINGVAYRFEAGAFYESRPNVWVVHYAWIYESGIFWNNTLQSDLDVVFPPSITGLQTAPTVVSPTFIAPPFYSIDAIPNPDSPENPPTFRPRLEYTLDASGYQQLVGLPPL